MLRAHFVRMFRADATNSSHCLNSISTPTYTVLYRENGTAPPNLGQGGGT